MLYFFIIPQNGKSSVQKARESSRVHVHFGIFSPIFFNTFVNLKVVLMFLRTFSWDFFRTWVRNFPLGRFNSIKVCRTSGSILFKVKCHNSKNILFKPYHVSWCFNSISLGEQLPIHESGSVYASLHSPRGHALPKKSVISIYLSVTVVNMFCED